MRNLTGKRRAPASFLPRWFPTLLVAWLVASAAPASARAQTDSALFWRVSKDGQPAGFLLGTIHSEDPRVLDFPDSFIEELKSCQVFAMEMVPDLPTLDESGVKGYELVGWNGLFAPGGTPKAIITKLYNASVKALGQPDVKKRLASMGAEAGGNTPVEFRKFLRAEMEKWAKVVKAAGMKVVD